MGSRTCHTGRTHAQREGTNFGAHPSTGSRQSIASRHKIIKCLYIEQCNVENQWTAAQEGGIFPVPDLAWSKCLCSPVGGG